MSTINPEKKKAPWFQPEGVSSNILVNNNLTRSLIPFIPSTPNHIKWYICGPTVYDSSHLGHARTYLAFDILRRIMTDYFRFNVSWVMNITDIDDKIILRARERNIPFNDLARQYEVEFLEDMRALRVLPPDTLTRVTEYVPEIITFVQKILDRGYAYESNGSVYFDTTEFQKTHSYAKLQPGQVGDAKLFAEGEGALAAGGEKRHPIDFALWKKSKEGEPSWSSPWGEGRPGWHIECSAMAGDVLGETVDIHSGGVDLQFPHHDNEIAQSEAFFDSKQWVNYFLHSGHLDIEGLKMSKSLKNFVTIREALKTYSARQIRMLFLQHRYDKGMNYSKDAMELARDKEKQFQEFFHTVKALLRETSPNNSQHWGVAEKDLQKEFNKTRTEIDEALRDNFDTPTVITKLGDLVRTTHKYINANTDSTSSSSTSSKNLSTFLVLSVTQYITFIFKVFGLVEGSSEIGFGSEEGSGAPKEEVLTPVLNAFSHFRDAVRESAIKKDFSRVLSNCDNVRDEVLPQLGVRLEDRPGGVAVWKLEAVEDLLRELAFKKEAEQKKLAAKLEASKKEQEKLLKGSTVPEQMFKEMKDKYSQFDERGIPTHDNEGKELSKSAYKKLQKEWDTQLIAHKKYLEWISKNPQQTINNGM